MAALHERDERWIVQERADGANCNNWHWTFKDVTARTKAALHERLKAVEFPPGLEGWRITSCSATGECSLSNRKGRLFLTYELDLTLGLTMERSGGGGDAIEASLRFPDVSATEIDELQCELSVTASSALGLDDELESRRPTALPEAVRAQAVPFLTQRLGLGLANPNPNPSPSHNPKPNQRRRMCVRVCVRVCVHVSKILPLEPEHEIIKSLPDMRGVNIRAAARVDWMSPRLRARASLLLHTGAQSVV